MPLKQQNVRSPLHLGELFPFVSTGLHVHVLKSYGSRQAPGFTLEAKFHVLPGFTILVGQSGAGKSTLLRCVAGLTDPDRGRISLDTRVLFDSEQRISLPPAQRNVAFVFQHLALFPHLTVEANVGYGLRNIAGPERDSRITAILDSFKVDHRRRCHPRQISGGERQRVALARALVTEPAALLLDEPMSSLDVRTKASIAEDLRHWNENHNVPILYVTHNQDEMIALGQRVILFGEWNKPPSDLVPRNFTPGEDNPVIDNTFDVICGSPNPLQATTNCQISDSDKTVEVPLTTFLPGTRLEVRVHAKHVFLSSAVPEIVGPVNVFEGEIVSVSSAGARFVADLDCAGVRVKALAARSIFETLSPGRRLWAFFKPNDCLVSEALTRETTSWPPQARRS